MPVATKTSNEVYLETLTQRLNTLQRLFGSDATNFFFGLRRIDIACYLETYEDRFGESAVKALFRFIDWAKENGKSDEFICANVTHDLHGARHQNNDCFAPRTLRY